MNKVKGSLFFIVFVAMLGLMLIAPIMPPLIRELGLQESHSGWIVSIGSVMMALTAPLWGKLSDKFGRKPIILVGFGGMAISCLLFAVVLFSGLQHWISGGLLLGWMIATRSLIGIFIPAILSSSQAYMSDVTEGEERTHGMALISAANGLGLVLGPAIAGAFTLIGLLWPLYFGIFTAVCALVIAKVMIPPAPPMRQEKQVKDGVLQPGLGLYLMAGFSTMIGIVTLQVIGGFYLQDRLLLTSGETARAVSFGLMCSGVAMLLVQVLQMRLLRWQPMRMIIWGSLCSAVGMVLFLVPGTMSLYYGDFFLFGIGAGLMMPGFMAGASLAVGKERQGGVAGMVAAVQGVASIIAPLLSTTLYQLDSSIPFLLAGCLIALSALVLLLSKGLRRSGRRVS